MKIFDDRGYQGECYLNSTGRRGTVVFKIFTTNFNMSHAALESSSRHGICEAILFLDVL